MARTFDLVVMGAGNAGMGAAGVAKAAGKSVAVIESWEVGGTCPLRGCVPKKVMVAAAQVLDQIAKAGQHHISVDKPSLDWPKLIERVQGFVDGVPDSFRESLDKRGIELIKGEARFSGPDTVSVNGEELQAKKIVIATGSRPRPLDLEGAEHLITSDDILTLPRLPESIIFIGGGVIALEFSHVFARAGADVTILEAMPRLLSRMDQDAVSVLRKETERIGVSVHTDVEVGKITRKDGSLIVEARVDGQDKTFRADVIANGAGRIPNVDQLDLAAGNIDHEGLRISVDEHMRSVSNPDVFITGDALAISPQLSPVATYEGRRVGEMIVSGELTKADYSPIPANIYTVPALASVGLTEQEARDQGLDFDVKANDMTDWRSAKTYAEYAAYAKVLIEKESGKILGAHMVGHGGEETIHLFALAIKYGLSAGELSSNVFGYPTFSSDIKYLL